VNFFFKDGLGFNCLELGLEVLHVVGGRVASTTGIGHVRPDIFDLITSRAPVEMLLDTDSAI
jgi:hypothetical protein